MIRPERQQPLSHLAAATAGTAGRPPALPTHPRRSSDRSPKRAPATSAAGALRAAPVDTAGRVPACPRRRAGEATAATSRLPLIGEPRAPASGCTPAPAAGSRPRALAEAMRGMHVLVAGTLSASSDACQLLQARRSWHSRCAPACITCACSSMYLRGAHARTRKQGRDSLMVPPHLRLRRPSGRCSVRARLPARAWPAGVPPARCRCRPMPTPRPAPRTPLAPRRARAIRPPPFILSLRESRACKP